MSDTEATKDDGQPKEVPVVTIKLVDGNVSVQIHLAHFPTLTWASKLLDLQIDNMIIAAQEQKKPKIIKPGFFRGAFGKN